VICGLFLFTLELDKLMNLLRPYQLNQHKAIHIHQDNPVVVAHTGTGKTNLLAYELNQDQARSLVIVPSNSLKDNIIDRYKSLYGASDHFAVSTYQSLVNNPLGTYKTIHIDEAHQSACQSIKTILNKIPHDRIIGYTATPQRLDGKPLNMYNRIIPSESMRWFIDQGYLADYSLLTVKGNSLRDELADSYNDRLELQQELLDTKAQIDNDVDLWREHAYGFKTFFFCTGQKHGKSLLNKLVSTFPEFKFAYIDSKSGKDYVDRVIQDFKTGLITGIVNIDLLVLGVDCPDAQCCYFLRFTYSLVRYLQCLGRVLRPSEGKKAVILDPYGNCLYHGHPDMVRSWTLDGKVKRSHDVCEKCSGCGMPLVEKIFAKANAENELYSTVCPNCMRLNIFQYPVVFRRKKKKKAVYRSVELTEYVNISTVSSLLNILNHPSMPVQIKRKLILAEKGVSNSEKYDMLIALGDSDGLARQLINI
jgi:superfamily II DNA or RNA helicase